VNATHVLVIDDSLTVRKLVELSMKGQGARLEFASSGQEGCAKALATLPQVILLDFILPDMRGTDVCRVLATDPRTAQVPIVIMSGKGAGLREHFQSFPSVVGFADKPFTGPEIMAWIRKATEKAPALQTSSPQASAPQKAPSLFTFPQKEAAAKALFGLLKLPLGRIPEWLPQQGTTPAAAFFAKKLLTPDLMDRLMDALVPIFREVLGTSAPPASPPPGTAGLEGSFSKLSLMDLFRWLASSRVSGELSLSSGDKRLLTFWREGTLLLVSSADPEAYSKDGNGLPATVAPGALARAQAEQRASGKPLFISLAEAGALPQPFDLTGALAQAGQGALAAAFGWEAVRFSWQDRSLLPPYADAHGRPIPLLQCELILLRARGAPPPSRPETEQTVLERAPDFSQKIRQLDFDAAERRVLTLIDGRSPKSQLLERSGLERNEALRALTRLTALGLIRGRDREGVRAGSVFVLDLDPEHFVRPLERLLRHRGTSCDFTPLLPDPAVARRVADLRPQLVLINADAPGPIAPMLPKAAREAGAPQETAWVAIVDSADARRDEELMLAGFDAVLAQPIAVSDLERLLHTPRSRTSPAR